MNQFKDRGGFTLIEVLVVIGIIAILAAIVLVAINPARQFAQARDTQRTSNVNAILNAMGQRIADNRGVFDGTFTAGGVSYTCPVLVASTIYTIGVGASASAVAPATANIDLSCITPTYIAAQLPVDPRGGVWNSTADYNTRYNVMMDTTGRITVSAPGAEITTPINVTR